MRDWRARRRKGLLEVGLLVLGIVGLMPVFALGPGLGGFLLILGFFALLSRGLVR
jgi:hypothetical protein